MGRAGIFALGVLTGATSVAWATDCGDSELVEELALVDSVGQGLPKTLVDSVTRLRLIQNRQWGKDYLVCIDLEDPSSDHECARIEPSGEE